MMPIRINEHVVPVYDAFDVVVCGGGVAGIASALSASRQGSKVLLLEKQCLLGGLAVSGLVTIYLPLDDGCGHQLSFGIAEELLRLAVKDGGIAKSPKYPEAWMSHKEKKKLSEERFQVGFNPVYFALECEQLLLSEGVTILYDSLLCGVEVIENQVSAVIFRNAGGEYAAIAKAFVDASGSALIFYEAGENVRTYQKGNPIAGWYYYLGNGELSLKTLGFADDILKTNNGSDSEKIQGTNGRDVARFLCLSHRRTLQDILIARERGELTEPAVICGMPQIRMIRCLSGKYKLKESDCFKEFKDSIGMIGDWRASGPRFEIPFSSLCGKKIRNVFAAGRCISNDDDMWNITRVIPACAVTGEAAGMAASIVSKMGSINVSTLQNQLVCAGQKIFFHDIC